jgi:transcriptional regulator with XRE-family HTH domain
MIEMSASSPTVTAMEVFADNVKQIILRDGHSVTSIAAATGMSRPGLSAMLNGRGGNCSLESAEKIANAISTPLFELLKPAE